MKLPKLDETLKCLVLKRTNEKSVEKNSQTVAPLKKVQNSRFVSYELK